MNQQVMNVYLDLAATVVFGDGAT